MNKIKINLNKKIFSLIVLILTIIIFIYPIYIINNKIKNYKNDVLDDYTKLAELEKEKRTFDVYNKILNKDSEEFFKIKKYILSSDKKEVLGLINEIELYTKKVGLVDQNDFPVKSVNIRENSELSKYNANELVLDIKVSGKQKEINNFLNILNNLPLVSYIEKIDIKFEDLNLKNNANIILVIYQKNEIK